MKNHNRNYQNRNNQNRNNQNKNNPQNQNRQQPPSRNDSGQFTCYNCNKPGHLARNCRNRRRSAPQANLTEEQLIAMISKINIVGGSEGWWVDTGASRHVCYDRAMFKSYSETVDKKVLLGDSHSTIVAGTGEVELKFTS
ncbi:hypothetical protein ACOSQ4_022159 [Xanthoceras sorbifolium]